MKHTPGPWLVCEDGRNVYQPDLDVCITSDNVYTAVLNDREALANARLIAAAPDLHKALIRLLECPDLNLDELEDETVEAIKEAQKADRKARLGK